MGPGTKARAQLQLQLKLELEAGIYRVIEKVTVTSLTNVTTTLGHNGTRHQASGRH